MAMWSALQADNCEGCENRAEIMGAEGWQYDALVVGAGVVLMLLLVYLKK
jgi:hypothetical protein